MYSVHGRAAYYREKSIGTLDGGSVVGKLIFEAIYRWFLKIQKIINSTNDIKYK